MTVLAWAPWVLAVGVASWVLAVLAAPVLPAWPAAIVYGISSLVCHQLPERSLYWGAVQFAVCSRCTGIYVGAAIAAVVAAAFDPARVAALRPHVRPLLVAGAAPTAVTVLAEWLGAWAPSHAVRLATGLPLGASVLATVAVAMTLNYEQWRSPPDEPQRPRKP